MPIVNKHLCFMPIVNERLHSLKADYIIQKSGLNFHMLIFCLENLREQGE